MWLGVGEWSVVGEGGAGSRGYMHIGVQLEGGVVGVLGVVTRLVSQLCFCVSAGEAADHKLQERSGPAGADDTSLREENE